MSATVPIYDLSRETIFRPTGRVSDIPADPRYAEAVENLRKQKASFWTEEKVKGLFARDAVVFPTLPDDIRLGTERVYGFLAFSDELIDQVIRLSCINSILVPELRSLYNYECMMEKTHSIVYNNNVQAIVSDPKRRNELQHAVEHEPLVKLKAELCQRYITDTRKPAYTIVGKMATEAISFSSSFAWIDWLKTQRYDLPGSYLANAEISRDEGRHVDTGGIVHRLLDDPLTPDNVREIFDEFGRVEVLFSDGVIPKRPLDRMSLEMMTQHIEHTKAHAATTLDMPDLYPGTSTPFKFMVPRSLRGKANFFEKESDQYTELDCTEDVEMGITDQDAAC